MLFVFIFEFSEYISKHILQFHASFFTTNLLGLKRLSILLYMKSELCPKCSKKKNEDKKIFDETTVTMKCKHCHKTFKLTYDEKTFPTNINSFNWGAFFPMAFMGFFLEWNTYTLLGGYPIGRYGRCLLLFKLNRCNYIYLFRY